MVDILVGWGAVDAKELYRESLKDLYLIISLLMTAKITGSSLTKIVLSSTINFYLSSLRRER